MTLFAPPQPLVLRPYQQGAVDALAAGLKRGGKRQMLCAPTGSGKTVIAAYLTQRALAKGSRVVFVADTIALVWQTARVFASYGIPHGVVQSKNSYGKAEPVQICSAQTIERRGFLPAADVLLLDEAHRRRNKVIKLAVDFGVPMVGLSATPMTDGLGKIYDGLVNAVSTDALVKNGDLAPLKIYAAQEIDMRGAEKTAGEWRASEVRARSRPIIGDIVSEWQRMTAKHFGGAVKTLLFSADTAHGEELCAAFQAAGFDFRQSTFRNTDAETREMVDSFRHGEFTGLVSVEKFVLGFDVPDVRCLIGARPYSRSLSSFVQQLGRGMRTSPGKDYCLYLDHAGNFEGWHEDVMDFWAQGVTRLDDGEKRERKPSRREDEERQAVKCACGYVLGRGQRICPACGKTMTRRASVDIAPGRMRELTAPGSREWVKARSWVWAKMCGVAIEWKRGDTGAARRLALAQYRTLYGEWPMREWGYPWTEMPDARVKRKMVNQIRSWRGR